MCPHLSVDGKLTSGEPGIGLDSPNVSGKRRTATSANSLNYGEPRERMGSATFDGAAPAVGRPFFAGKREETRYAASAPTSAILLNYGTPKGTSERTTFGRATPAIKRPLLAGERRDACYAAFAPSSAISENFGPERVTRGVATFYGAAQAEERPFLARKREEARHAASDPSSTVSLNYDALSRGLEPGSLRSIEPLGFGGAASAEGRPLLAMKREEARHAASAPTSTGISGPMSFEGATPAREQPPFAER